MGRDALLQTGLSAVDEVAALLLSARVLRWLYGPFEVDRAQEKIATTMLANAGPPRQLGAVDDEPTDEEINAAFARFEREAQPAGMCGYWQQLDGIRREIVGREDAEAEAEGRRSERSRLGGARINRRTKSGGSADEGLHEAIEDVGWERVQAVVRWGYGEVLAGRKPAGLFANTFIGAGWGALLGEYAAAQAAEEARQERTAKRDAEEAARGPGMSSELMGELADGFLRRGRVG